MSRLVACCLVIVATQAAADGLTVVGGSPRAIGRAGTSAVGDDGAGALLVNPAAIARRPGFRAQLGVAFTDDEISWRADRAAAPVARDQAAASALPVMAAVGSIGAWVVGGGVMTAAVVDHALRDPADVPRPEDLGAAFDYRYNGIAGGYRRDTVAVAVARRLGEAFAIGVSVAASRVVVRETRRIWAGFGGVSAVGDPRRDVELSVVGTDRFVPSATAGILIAPPDQPMELGASVVWTARSRLEGDVAATGTTGGPTVQLGSPTARLTLRDPVAVRAGARYLGDRYVVEVGGDLWFAPAAAAVASWRIDDLQIVDPSTVTTRLATLPSRLSQRTHGAARAAVDVEVLTGFLWATAGYAYTVGGTTAGRLSPSLGALGGHTIALGVEATAGRFTGTIGWSRTYGRARAGGEALRLDNPFAAGDAVVAGGRYDGTIEQVGLLIDIELGAR